MRSETDIITVKDKANPHRSKLNTESSDDIVRTFNSFIAMFLTIAVLIVTGYIIKRVVPNTFDANYIKNNCVGELSVFKPEKAERYQYFILTVMFPILFFLFYLIANKFRKKEKDIQLFAKSYPFFLIAIFAFFCIIFETYPLFVDMGLLHLEPLISMLGSGIVLYLMYIYGASKSGGHTAANAICLFIAAAGAFCCAWLFITPSYSGMSLYNVDAYYDPIFQVYSGKAPIFDFNNQYGFYPYFFLPIFKLLGGISIFKFSVLLSLLMLISCLALLAVIWMNVRNKILALIGYGTVLFFIICFPIIVNNGYYAQYQPHRILFPSLILLNSCLWLRAKKLYSKISLSVIGYILSFLSIIWNTETGFIVLAAWCLFRIYCCLQRYSLSEKTLYIQSLKAVFFTAVSFIAAISAIKLLIYSQCGKPVSFSDMMFVQNHFYVLGFFMLPMNLFHPWLFVVFVYAVALMVSIRSIKFFRRNDKSTDERSCIYFLTAVLGMGLFSYYQGRSHDNVLINVCWPCILLTVFFTQNCFERLSRHIGEGQSDKFFKKTYFIDISKIVIAVVLFVSFALSSPYYFKNNQTLNGMFLKSSCSQSSEEISNLSFIRQNSNGGKSIDLIIRYPGYYYTKLGMKNSTDIVSDVNWLLKSDVNKVFNWLEKTDDTVFLDERTISVLNSQDSKRLKEILKSRFTLVDSNNQIYCYRPN